MVAGTKGLPEVAETATRLVTEKLGQVCNRNGKGLKELAEGVIGAKTVIEQQAETSVLHPVAGRSVRINLRTNIAKMAAETPVVIEGHTLSIDVQRKIDMLYHKRKLKPNEIARRIKLPAAVIRIYLANYP